MAKLRISNLDEFVVRWQWDAQVQKGPAIENEYVVRVSLNFHLDALRLIVKQRPESEPESTCECMRCAQCRRWMNDACLNNSLKYYLFGRMSSVCSLFTGIEKRSYCSIRNAYASEKIFIFHLQTETTARKAKKIKYNDSLQATQCRGNGVPLLPMPCQRTRPVFSPTHMSSSSSFNWSPRRSSFAFIYFCHCNDFPCPIESDCASVTLRVGTWKNQVRDQRYHFVSHSFRVFVCISSVYFCVSRSGDAAPCWILLFTFR